MYDHYVSIIQDLGIFGNAIPATFWHFRQITGIVEFQHYFRHAANADNLPGMPELSKIPRSWICMHYVQYVEGPNGQQVIALSLTLWISAITVWKSTYFPIFTNIMVVRMLIGLLYLTSSA